MKYLIFSIAGGIGKNILATAVLTSIKKKYPEHQIIVMSAYLDIFLNNPNVYRVYPIENAHYFREDYIKEDTIIFHREPYREESFIKKEKHLIETWCEMCDVECITHKPEIYLTSVEIELAKAKYKSNKPILVMQTNGGLGTQYSWTRDIPNNQAQLIVDSMKEKYRILHIRKPEQPALKDVETVTGPIRDLMALISISDKRLFMDSFAEHCAGAFDLPSVVCWIENKPEVYSYDCHTNILPKQKKKFTHGITKGFDDADWTGNKLYECPYDVNEMFNVTKIIEALK